MSLVTKIELLNSSGNEREIVTSDLQLHDHLTDDADWDNEYWDFDKTYLKEYCSKIEKVIDDSEKGIIFQALWVGETPSSIAEITKDEFIKLISNNKVGTKTKYIVNKNA